MLQVGVRSHSSAQAREGGRPNGLHGHHRKGQSEISIIYDQYFRMETAGNPTQSWAKVDPSLYAQCFTGQARVTENWCTHWQALATSLTDVGMSAVNKVRPELEVSIISDAFGSWGCGALNGREWFQLKWAGHDVEYNIIIKELVPIMIAACHFLEMADARKGKFSPL